MQQSTITPSQSQESPEALQDRGIDAVVGSMGIEVAAGRLATDSLGSDVLAEPESFASADPSAARSRLSRLLPRSLAVILASAGIAATAPAATASAETPQAITASARNDKSGELDKFDLKIGLYEWRNSRSVNASEAESSDPAKNGFGQSIWENLTNKLNAALGDPVSEVVNPSDTSSKVLLLGDTVLFFKTADGTIEQVDTNQAFVYNIRSGANGSVEWNGTDEQDMSEYKFQDIAYLNKDGRLQRMSFQEVVGYGSEPGKTLAGMAIKNNGNAKLVPANIQSVAQSSPATGNTPDTGAAYSDITVVTEAGKVIHITPAETHKSIKQAATERLLHSKFMPVVLGSLSGRLELPL